MNRRYLNGLVLGLAYIFFAQACAEDKLVGPSVSDAGVSHIQTDTPVGDPIEERVVTEVIVELDDETADLLADSSADKLFAGIDGVSYERLFPDAGEWEQRHRENGLHKFYKVTYEHGIKANTAVAVLGEIAGVAGVEVPAPLKTCALPFNDPYLSTYQWQFYNDGKMINGFVKGCDINVVPVWENYTAGSSNVIVSIVDEGIQMNHPDLQGVILAGGANGSKNFTDNSYNITAGDHGCHVAGIIGGINNNKKGICGVAGGNDGTGGVTMMSCQIFGTRSGNSANAIVWGADHGAVISQNSWGYNYDYNDDGQLTGSELTAAMAAQASSSDKAAIDYFVKNAGCDKSGNQLPDSPMKGGVVIFAAGNDNIGNGAPGNYASCIAVGATGPDGKRASYSNYGSWVDICAPGGEADRFPSSNGKSYILSCGSGSGYVFMCGTSMACPMVSGVAALVVSYFGGPGFTNEKLKSMLLDNENRTVIPPTENIAGMVDAYAIFNNSINKNENPVISTNYTGDYRVQIGKSLAIDYTVSDADGDAVTLELSGDGSSTLTKTGTDKYRLTINSDAKWKGTHKATLTAKDERDAESTLDVEYTVFENIAPVISTTYTGNFKARVGETLVINYKATDADGDVCTFSLTGDGSASLTKTGTNTCRVTVTTTEANVGEHKAVLKADDGKDGVATVDIDYAVVGNNAPLIECKTKYDHDIPVGTSVTLDFAATDPYSGKVTFDLESDASAYISSTNGNNCSVTLRTTSRYVGEHSIVLKASNTQGNTSTETISYKIYVNYPPQISTDYSGDYKVLVGVGLDAEFTITDQNGDAVTVTYDNDGSSSFTRLAGDTYRLHVNATAAYAGVHSATIKADDGKGGKSEYPIQYTIINNHAPKVTLVGSYEKEIAVGQDLSANVKVEDEDGDALDVVLESDGSAQMTRTSAGNYTVKFLPSASNVGNHTATVKATDIYGVSASVTLSYKTYVNQPPVITMGYSSPTTLLWYQKYGASFTATDPEGKPLKFTVVSDNPISVPSISGNAATVNVNDGTGKFHGTCTITATAEDHLGLKAEKTLSYTVLENRAPEIAEGQEKFVKDIVLKESGDRITLDLKALWSDADGESMQYTCTSSNTSVAAISNSGDTYYLKAGAVGASTITLTAKDQFGAVSTRTFGFGVFNDDNGPVLYPNPVKDFLTVRVGNEVDVALEIFNEMQKSVFTAEGKSSIFSPMKVDLRTLAPGRYTVKLNCGGNRYEKEIVKL